MRNLVVIFIIMSIFNWTGLSGQVKNSDTSVHDLKWMDIKDKIYPMLKQKLDYNDTSKVFEIDENSKPIFDVYLGDILITYLIEYESYFTYINNNQIAKWDIDKDSLKKIALTNLENLASGRAQFHGDTTFAMITLNGNIEASLMLYDDFWSYVSGIMNSKDLVIGIPSRDVLLVTHIDSKEGLEKIRISVKDVYEKGDHVITKWTFKRENGKWIKFEYIE